MPYANGCRLCGGTPRTDRTLCAQCAKEKNANERAERARRAKLGLCTHLGCPRKPAPERAHCRKHLDYHAAKVAAAKKQQSIVLSEKQLARWSKAGDVPWPAKTTRG